MHGSCTFCAILLLAEVHNNYSSLFDKLLFCSFSKTISWFLHESQTHSITQKLLRLTCFSITIYCRARTLPIHLLLTGLEKITYNDSINFICMLVYASMCLAACLIILTWIFTLLFQCTGMPNSWSWMNGYSSKDLGTYI